MVHTHRSHAWLLAMALSLAGCHSKSDAVAAARPHVVPSAEPPAGDGLDGPVSPSSAHVAALVPWKPASEWQGKPGSIPPKEFSLFDLPKGSPLLGYAALSRDACEAELQKRTVGFVRAEDTAGVRAPIRLSSTLHGVAFHSMFPPAQRAKSKADLIDCRLALVLDDFAASLASKNIVEVIQLSAYRTKAEYGCTVKYPGEQHCAALAIDVGSFVKRDGTRLVVERDFHGKIGSLTCGTGVAPKNELWDMACSSAGKYFQVVLTPNWNSEHKNHFHLELSVHDWVLVR